MEKNAVNTANKQLDINPILRPSSVAIIGMSTKPGSASQVVLNNLLAGGYTGTVHLVGRSGGSFEGRTILSSVSELPEDVGLAILMVPSSAVLETMFKLLRS